MRNQKSLKLNCSIKKNQEKCIVKNKPKTYKNQLKPIELIARLALTP
jgi:hypothetical protein